MPDQTIRVSVLDQRVVQPGWQGAGGEGREGPRKRGFAGDLARALPAAQAAQCLVGRQNLDQQTGGWNVEHGFCDKGPRQCRAFGGWTPWKSLPAWQERLDPYQSQHADQLLVVSAQRAERRVVEPGQKFFLNADPVGG